MKLWAGRFKKETNSLVDEYCASIEFDQALAEFDIQGSLAYVRMLGKCNLLKKESVDLITQGLHQILVSLKSGELTFSIQDEDVHMNIEKMLFNSIGDEAGKLHTGRSRNDQVALDLYLYLRCHLLKIIMQLCELNKVIVQLAEKHINVIMPGYTHLQRAEPIRFSHHMMAYFNMFYRDIQRLITNFDSVNVCPLGAGALAGGGVLVDREYVASLLNFDSIYENSLDAVSNRDFIAEFLFNASLIMMHFSKMSEEIILWCSQEFSFIELDDQYCTGSSMMPLKKSYCLCRIFLVAGIPVRAVRSRWRIENETFNTLKNQGYNFSHNYGYGYEQLCSVMTMLMLLVFLIDQVQQLCCKHYQKARNHVGTFKALFEKMRVLIEYAVWQNFKELLIFIGDPTSQAPLDGATWITV